MCDLPACPKQAKIALYDAQELSHKVERVDVCGTCYYPAIDAGLFEEYTEACEFVGNYGDAARRRYALLRAQGITLVMEA